MQEAHQHEGHSVQDGQGVPLRAGCARHWGRAASRSEESGAAAPRAAAGRSHQHHAGALAAARACRATKAEYCLSLPCGRRQAPLRPQAVRLWWPDQARLPQEGARCWGARGGAGRLAILERARWPAAARTGPQGAQEAQSPRRHGERHIFSLGAAARSPPRRRPRPPRRLCCACRAPSASRRA